MRKLIYFLFILSFFNSCSSSDSDASNENESAEVPPVRSYVTYISQNSVTLNGVIDNTNNYYQGPGTYKVGFVFRTGNIDDSSNDQVIMVDENVEYEPYKKYFSTNINSLLPNTKYYYTCFAENGNYEKNDWEEFTTSEIPCVQLQNNYVSISGVWNTVYPEINDPLCCDEGNFGIRFGTWPNIYEINFNELNNGFPNTGQYFGVDYSFDITDYNKEVVKSSNQVLIENISTPGTELFVNNNGVTLTIIFCNTTLRNGTILNGKVSVLLP